MTPQPRAWWSVVIDIFQIVGAVAGVVGVVLAVWALIYSARNPDRIEQIIETLAGDTPTPLPTNTLTPTVIPTNTATPTDTPPPTSTPTPIPTYTPLPTYTSLPTYTPYPTLTPVPPTPTPSGPTNTPRPPTATPSPVPTSTATVTNTPSPTPTPEIILEIGEWAKNDDVWLKVDRVSFTKWGDIYIYMVLKNNTQNTLMFEWDPSENYSLVDNTNHRYRLGFSLGDSVIVAAGETVKLERTWERYSAVYSDNHFFKDSVTDLYFTVSELSRISYAKWHIPIHR